MERITKLITDYIVNYNNQEHPFLLFDLAHVNENDHTRVLLSILKFNNYQFLPSFLQTIGAPGCNGVVKAPPTDQEPAIGDKGKGFIDLYFEYRSENSDEKFILENKIYGAADTKHQLARYIATVIDPDMSNDVFLQEIWEKWANNQDGKFDKNVDFEHIHVVYLTADGSKKPSLNSLPKYFGNRDRDDSEFDESNMRINYYPVNYADDIIPWLENDVLPNMPYSDNGIAIAGIRQYIASLKSMFSSRGNSTAVEDFVKEITFNDDLDKYKKIIQTMDVIKSLADKKNKVAKEEEKIAKLKRIAKLKSELKDDGFDVEAMPELQSLARELRACAMGIFANDGSELGGDWKLYFTPSFIFLYRQRWADLDTRKYSIPSIYFVTSTLDFINNKETKWKLQVDHLNKDTNEEISPFKLGNHGKTAYYELPNGSNMPKQENISKPENRKEYYKSLVTELKEFVTVVDEVVNEEYSNNNDREGFQQRVLNNLCGQLLQK